MSASAKAAQQIQRYELAHCGLINYELGTYVLYEDHLKVFYDSLRPYRELMEDKRETSKRLYEKAAKRRALAISEGDLADIGELETSAAYHREFADELESLISDQEKSK